MSFGSGVNTWNTIDEERNVDTPYTVEITWTLFLFCEVIIAVLYLSINGKK